jgi:two-component system, OmpR family, sensor kinase
VSLRARLLLTVGGLLLVALVGTGALVVGLTRASLVEQIDDQLKAQPPLMAGRGPGMHDDADDPTGRRTAFILYDAEGTIIAVAQSGYASSPDPLPKLPPIPGDEASALTGRIFTTSSADGSLSYRVLIDQGPMGTTRVLAAPMRGVEDAMAVLVRNLAVVGAFALAVLLVLGWVIIRRDLRPLEDMASTATRIAGGDLSQRVDHPGDRTEVGRLGIAFNTMLDRIQASFEEQRSALQAKERSERRLRQFVADASHELRTPLTALRGYADLRRAGGLTDKDELDRAMTRIGTESERMSVLVEDMLLLARLDQGRPLRRDRVDFSGLVDDAVSDTRAIEPGRPMEADVSEGVVVEGDEHRLRQVIANLMANVRVHTPPGIPVEVILSAGDGRCTLSVIDHGPGIDPEHAERVFDRFYRADPARSRDHGGSGLGLAIAASVVEAHGGTVIHGPTEGGGATFTVTLPTAT